MNKAVQLLFGINANLLFCVHLGLFSFSSEASNFQLGTYICPKQATF